MIVAFDCHERPWGLSPNLRQAIGLSKDRREPLVLGGDTFPFIPYGYRVFGCSITVREFLEALGDGECILIDGNHDPDYLLHRLFDSYPNITVCRDYTIGDVYITHGHRYGPLWSWLSWFADDIVRVAMAVCPGTWYRFSKWAGWMPSQVQAEKRYHAVIRSLLNRALVHHDKTGQFVAMGHGHKHYSLWESGSIVIASLPPLATGWYCKTYGTELSFDHL